MTSAARHRSSGPVRSLSRSVAASLLVAGCTAAGLVAAAPAVALDPAESPVTYTAEGTPASASGDYDGVWSGTASYAAGVDGGQAFELLGTANGLTMPAGLVDFGTRPFSVSYDVRVAAGTANEYVLGARSICDNAGEGWFDVAINGVGGLNAEVGGSGSYRVLSSPVVINDDEWHSVELRRTDAGLTLVVDGVETSFDGTPQAINPPHLQVGDSPCAVEGTAQGLASQLDGRIDNLVVALLAPTVTAQPTDQSTAPGEPVTFTASASDETTTTVQWQRSTDGGAFVDVDGATSTSYTLDAPSLDDDGDDFRAVFTSSAGTAVSEPANLTVVLDAPVITEQPRSNEVGEDPATPGTHTASFTSSATADGPLTGQWQVSTDFRETWTDIPGETASGTDEVESTLTVTRSRDEYSNSYRIVWSNDAGSTTSNAAAVSVHWVEFSDPADATVVEGQSASFTVEIDGTLTPFTRWEVSTDDGDTWTVIEGSEDQNTYTIPVTSIDQDGNLYRAVAFAPVTDTSAPARLTVTEQPVAPSVPLDVTATQTGPGEVTITWRAPVDAGSSPITGFQVGYGTSMWGNGTEVGPGVFSHVFTDLPDGEYQASVAAVSDAGAGERAFVPFEIVTAVPVPEPPRPSPAPVPAPAPALPTAQAPVRETGAPTAARGALPRTGADQALTAMIGFMTVVAGGLLVASARRRRSA